MVRSNRKPRQGLYARTRRGFHVGGRSIRALGRLYLPAHFGATSGAGRRLYVIAEMEPRDTLRPGARMGASPTLHRVASALTSRGSTWRWRKIRAAILTRDRYACRYCGEYANTVDHVTPRSRGGDDSWANLNAACQKCNRAKGARPGPDQHAVVLGSQGGGLGLDDPGPLGRAVIR